MIDFDQLAQNKIDIFQMLEKYYAELSIGRTMASKYGTPNSIMKTFPTSDGAF